MAKRTVFIIILISLFFQYASSQTYPSNYFRSPLDIPLLLSGTFGELRSNHFHSGMDIKTQGTEGKKVYAVADGYVSRIKVSASGYGKALYITHPNGYISVYGHLRYFNDSLQKFIKKLQYKNEKYAVEAYPEKDRFKIKKGDIIAYSGNTGGSNGPHLHFEIREEASQYPINPLLFKSIKISDYTRPQIKGLAIYPEDENSSVNGSHDTLYIKVEGWGEKHRLSDELPIKLSGNISFGLNCYDKMNEINNHNGIYQLDLMIDSLKVFGLIMNRLSFSTTRYVNSLIDYAYYENNGSRYIRTCIDTNNSLFVYRNVKNNGIYNFSDSLKHEMEFVVKDAYGNISSLRFDVVSDDVMTGKHKKIKRGSSFIFSRPNRIEQDNISVSFPANSFYKSLDFVFDSLEKRGDYSAIYKLHNKSVAVQKYFYLSIKPDSAGNAIFPKLYVAYSPDGKEYRYAGSLKNKKYISAKARLLGYYTLEADTVKPIIKALNIETGKNVAGQKTIKMIIKDEESGIKAYNAYLNGKWVLMEYDAKNDLLVYDFDE
ncbi:MAG: M23 family metallopeptidase, partial [Chlorobi bacterium]|nr:M23 family metallopeptidase [Chlorobiota bacterium]